MSIVENVKKEKHCSSLFYGPYPKSQDRFNFSEVLLTGHGRVGVFRCEQRSLRIIMKNAVTKRRPIAQVTWACGRLDRHDASNVTEEGSIPSTLISFSFFSLSRFSLSLLSLLSLFAFPSSRSLRFSAWVDRCFSGRGFWRLSGNTLNGNGNLILRQILQSCEFCSMNDLAILI